MSKFITDEQRTQIVLLSNRGYTNRQIAIECGMKYATLCYWKGKIRKQGISLSSVSGRPKIKTLPIAKLSEQNRLLGTNYIEPTEEELREGLRRIMES